MEKYIYLLMLVSLCGGILEVRGVELPEAELSLTELIASWGYPIESHEALTEDGYYLTLHRIPHGRNENNDSVTEKPVMFLQHGLLCSSSNWVVNLPNQSLAFMLADNGFDVWMGNTRGGTFSKRHSQFSASSPEFWNFSVDEHAKYDLPAMVNYALNKTGQKQLYYVGHSQGSLIALAELGTNKELQERVKLFFALAPVAKFDYRGGLLRFMSTFRYAFRFIFSILGIRNFLPSADSLERFSYYFCPRYQELCDKLTFVSSSKGLKNFNRTRTPVYLAHTPAGTSMKNMYHYMQLVDSSRFQKYDYGLFGNWKRYHSYDPDEYDVTAVQNKIMIFYGDSDWLSIPQDVEWLASVLPNVIDIVKLKDYNHLDFVWGLSAGKLVYQRIIETAQRFERGAVV